VATRPEHRGRGQSPGHAYRPELYERIVEELLAEASPGAGAIASVVDEVSNAAPVPDRSAGDRIARDRQSAMAGDLLDRDPEALERTMARLDREQSEAQNRKVTEAIPADVAVRYVRDLAETWRKAEGGFGRQLLASALSTASTFWGCRRRPSTSARTVCGMASRQRYPPRWEYS
jgi:hypothetical protein